mmetsp:Transcript_27513/g.43358  ORF Transcript_27513/g.43358 Transcript_27513/m.43358 type:complete len:263 (+) Transcript_27513:58-846(+)
MLPLDGRTARYSNFSNRAYSNGYSSNEYLRRIYDFNQMDFEAAFDQFMTLLSRNPAQVYKSSYYRKQTKNQWARDDPAFAVIQILLLIASACAYGVAFSAGSFWHFFTIIFKMVGIQYVGVGVFIASLGSWFANARLRQVRAGTVAQRVEWAFAWDAHCNAHAPAFLLLHVLQYFLLPLLMGRSWLALAAANTLYAASLLAYVYVTHLGYRALPFLSNTEVYLYPAGVIILLYVISLLLGLVGVSCNMTRIVSHFYFDMTLH